MNFSSYSAFFTSGFMSTPNWNTSSSSSSSSAGSFLEDLDYYSDSDDSESEDEVDASSCYKFTLQRRSASTMNWEDPDSLRSYLCLDLSDGTSEPNSFAAPKHKRNSSAWIITPLSQERADDRSNHLHRPHMDSISGENFVGRSHERATPRQSYESLRVLPLPTRMAALTAPCPPSPHLAHDNQHLVEHKSRTPTVASSTTSLRRSHRPSDSAPSIATHNHRSTVASSSSVASVLSLSSALGSTKSRTRAMSVTTPEQSRSNRANLLADTLARLEGLAKDSFFDDDDDDDDDDSDDDYEEYRVDAEPFTEPEDIVLPLSPSDPRPRSSFFSLSSASSSGARSRAASRLRGTLNSWLPLSSFVDLGGETSPADDEKWNWRSFIEVGVM
jgi:hypothetical protein